MTARLRISSAPDLLEIADVDAAEPVDVGLDVVAKRRPVEAQAVDGPAEADRILDGLGEVRGMDEQLLRNAAAEHAGAADLVFLGDRDARAEFGGDPGRADAAGPRPDDEQIVVVFAHRSAPPQPIGGQNSKPCLVKVFARLLVHLLADARAPGLHRLERLLDDLRTDLGELLAGGAPVELGDGDELVLGEILRPDPRHGLIEVLPAGGELQRDRPRRWR